MKRRLDQVPRALGKFTPPKRFKPKPLTYYDEPAKPSNTVRRRGILPKGQDAHSVSLIRGDRYQDSRGYLLVFCPDDPHANSKGYAFEHRLVMARHLGRPLITNEVVHHINQDPGDNRIENLQLFASNADHLAHHAELRRLADV